MKMKLKLKLLGAVNYSESKSRRGLRHTPSIELVYSVTYQVGDERDCTLGAGDVHVRRRIDRLVEGGRGGRRRAFGDVRLNSLIFLICL